RRRGIEPARRDRDVPGHQHATRRPRLCGGRRRQTGEDQDGKQEQRKPAVGPERNHRVLLDGGPAWARGWGRPTPASSRPAKGGPEAGQTRRTTSDKTMTNQPRLDELAVSIYKCQRTPSAEGGRRMKIRPLQDRLLVERIEEQEVRQGSIIIPDTAK